MLSPTYSTEYTVTDIFSKYCNIYTDEDTEIQSKWFCKCLGVAAHDIHIHSVRCPPSRKVKHFYKHNYSGYS